MFEPSGQKACLKGPSDGMPFVGDGDVRCYMYAFPQDLSTNQAYKAVSSGALGFDKFASASPRRRFDWINVTRSRNGSQGVIKSTHRSHGVCQNANHYHNRLIGNKLAVSQWLARLVFVRLTLSVREEPLFSRLYALFRRSLS
jgi:hypothetical protein